MKTNLSEQIESLLGEVRTEGIDVSFGEVINLHTTDPKELVITPEYQRLFRWSEEQRSRLIESILIGLPIPQIFTIENNDGVLELVDGLQRISSVLHFVDHMMIGPEDVRNQVASEPLRLAGCDLIKDLNGLCYEDLPQKLKFNLKRARLRMVTIKQSKSPIIRYEMFNRLNSGGSDLSSQEIRNCTARMLGTRGSEFYNFLIGLASYANFERCIEPLGDIYREKKTDHELVLRFLASKNFREKFRGNVSEWLNDYMKGVILEELPFDFHNEEKQFKSLFDFLSDVFGAKSFVKHRNGQPIGGLAPAYYEAVTQGILPLYDDLRSIDADKLQLILAESVASPEFRGVTGGSANSRAKFEGRISIIREAFEELI